MTEITDEYMKNMLGKAKTYSVMILKKTAGGNIEGADKIIWEHGRRNFRLRAEGILSIVCPVSGSTEVAGIGIFNCSVEETKKIMDGDPGVEAGIFNYEVYSCRGFPGDKLPQ